MASPITFSGFNQIDFNVVLNGIMQQESLPLLTLQDRQTTLQSTDSAYATLASKISALQTATDGLSNPGRLTDYTVLSTDASAVSVSADATAVPGRYDIVVNSLARAQVTTSSTTAPDADTTIVADGGTLAIGGATVTVAGPLTLAGLASAINGTTGIGVSASVMQTAPGAFRLLLTGNDAGAANAFTITNNLTGGTGVAFGANAVEAADASVTINNVAVTSTTNALTSVIPGATLTLLQEDSGKTIGVTIARDDKGLASRATAFISAYNDLIDFANSQVPQSGKAQAGALAHDTVLGSLRSSLRSALSSAFGSGSFTRLAEIGIGFDRNGHLTLDSAALSSAERSDPDGVAGLLAGDGTTGAFPQIGDLLASYTRSGGFVPSARAQVSQELSALATRIDDMQARLAIRRAALQQQFIAADQAMSRLNNQTGALASLGSSLSSNKL